MNFDHRSDEASWVTKSYINNSGFHLSNQATAITHAVRADRSITISGTANQIISSAGTQYLTGDRT